MPGGHHPCPAFIFELELIARGLCSVSAPSFAHFWTSLAYYAIGGLLLLGGNRFGRMPDARLARLMAFHLTDLGIHRLIGLRGPICWAVWMFGAFIFACAIDHTADALASFGVLPGVLTPDLRGTLAQCEAVVSSVTAIGVVAAAWLLRRAAGKWPC